MVEGADRDVTLTALKSIAPKKIWKQVARRFLFEGQISGEEYLNLTSDHPMRILGIEDRRLYGDGLKSYADLTAGRKPTLRYLHRVD